MVGVLHMHTAFDIQLVDILVRQHRVLTKEDKALAKAEKADTDATKKVKNMKATTMLSLVENGAYMYM